MTLGEYIEWMHSKGIKDDDTVLFLQDDGSGYTTELSDVPIVEVFKDARHGMGRGWLWETDPKWILGTGTT